MDHPLLFVVCAIIACFSPLIAWKIGRNKQIPREYQDYLNEKIFKTDEWD